MKLFLQGMIAFMLLALNHFSAYSQNKKIEIEVSDKQSNDLLFGANVQWLDTLVGATTNEFGVAQLDIVQPLPRKLVISFIGFMNDTILVHHIEKISVELMPDIVLNEVNVQSKKLTNFISSIDPQKTEKLNEGEWKKAACCNLSESFQTNASIDVNYTDAVTGAKEIKLLGLSGIYVQNLLENVPFMRGLSSTFGLDNIPAPWMKSISVSKGVPTVKSSYEGITGSMNIEFKNTFNDSTKLYFDMFANQNARIETNLLINHKINEKLGTMLMTNGSFTPVKQDMNHDGFLDQPLMKQYNFLNRWNYRSEKIEGQYMVKVLGENRQGGQISHVDGQHNTNLPLYEIGINTKRVEGFAKTGFIFDDHGDKSLGIQLSGVYHRQKSNFGLQQFNTKQASFVGNIMYQTNVKDNDNHVLVSGINFIYDNINEQLDSVQFNRNDFVPGIFIEYTYKWKEIVTLVTGLRADYHSRAGFQVNPRIHAKFSLTDNTTLRVAIGSGFRAPNILSENQSLLASSRKIIFVENPTKEVAWNYGISFSQKFFLFNREGNFSVDYFRTDFTKQAIVDIDNADATAQIYNLKGKSFSNSFLMEFNYEVLKGLDLKMAYRLEDVRATYHGELLRKPLQAMHKGLVALSYRTPNKQWQFDVNTSINGKRRLPNSFINDAGNRYSPRYVLLNAQILKYFKHAELFVGCENITNYKQKDVILGNPFSTVFDTYQVYAPVMGANIYGGFRIFIN
ncbi:MAG: TonB-dependent receptor [Bacteroidetes bacterium]|nr:TonB-dependent receptor [Bacteroidota bacterium]